MNTNIDKIMEGQLLLETISNKFNKVSALYKNIILGEQNILETDSPMFNCYEDYCFFKESFIQLVGVESFNNYEFGFLNKTIEELKFYLFNSDVQYDISEINGNNVISVNVMVNNEMTPVMYINPYFKSIKTIYNEYKSNLTEQIKLYELKLDELNISEKKLQLLIKNPLIGAENPKDMVKTVFNKSKKIKELKNKLYIITMDILDTQFQINNLKSLIKEDDSMFLIAEQETEIIINKLCKSFIFHSK